MPGAAQLARVDAQLGPGVRAQRVVLGEPLGDMPGQMRRQAPGLVDPGELLHLGHRGAGKLAALQRQHRPLGVPNSPPSPRSAPLRDGLAPATPTTRPAVDTIPSLAPSTAARSQFSRAARPPACGSPCAAATLRVVLAGGHLRAAAKLGDHGAGLGSGAAGQPKLVPLRRAPVGLSFAGSRDRRPVGSGHAADAAGRISIHAFARPSPRSAARLSCRGRRNRAGAVAGGQRRCRFE